MGRVRRVKRVLFLDFDGVLHPATAHFAVDDVRMPIAALRAAGLFVHVDALADALRPFEDVGVITHSSWRLTHTDSELRSLLDALGSRVIGATDRSMDREESIAQAVRTRDLGSDDFRVLDDQPELFVQFRGNVIACDPARGVGDAMALDKLNEWMGR